MSLTISISCSEKEYSIGQSAFSRLRKSVAYSANKSFGNMYNKLISASLHSDMFYLNFDIYVKRMIENNELSSTVVHFCMMSDVSGTLSSSECMEIYNAISQTNLEEKYGSVFSEDTLSFEKFKELLFECGKKKASMIWE